MKLKRLILLVIMIGAVLAVPTVGAQTSDTAYGEYEGVIESLDGKWAVVSGLRIKVNKAQLDDDIDRLYVGLGVEIDFKLKNGKFKALYIDDDDDDDYYEDDRGELTGTITRLLPNKSMVIGGMKFKIKKAEIDDEAPMFVGGRPDVEFYPKKFTKMIATDIDDD